MSHDDALPFPGWKSGRLAPGRWNPDRRQARWPDTRTNRRSAPLAAVVENPRGDVSVDLPAAAGAKPGADDDLRAFAGRSASTCLRETTGGFALRRPFALGGSGRISRTSPLSIALKRSTVKRSSPSSPQPNACVSQVRALPGSASVVCMLPSPSCRWKKRRPENSSGLRPSARFRLSSPSRRRGTARRKTKVDMRRSGTAVQGRSTERRLPVPDPEGGGQPGS